MDRYELRNIRPLRIQELSYLVHPFQIISPVLRALADEQEFVRDTAYKAGQRLVIAYADTALTLLLPELEKGLFDDNWRIRHSSVQLLGKRTVRFSCVYFSGIPGNIIYCYISFASLFRRPSLQSVGRFW